MQAAEAMLLWAFASGIGIVLRSLRLGLAPVLEVNRRWDQATGLRLMPWPCFVIRLCG